MNRLRRLLRLCAAFSALSLLSCAPRTPIQGGGPEEKAGYSLSGDRVPLSSYKGSVVMLSFWSSWCTQCVYELPMLQKLHERFGDRGFTVVGIAVHDTAGIVRTLQREKQISFPVLLDENDALANAFHIRGVPEVMFLDREGERFEFIDPKGGAVTTRVSGVRDWAAPEAVAVIERILAEN